MAEKQNVKGPDKAPEFTPEQVQALLDACRKDPAKLVDLERKLNGVKQERLAEEEKRKDELVGKAKNLVEKFVADLSALYPGADGVALAVVPNEAIFFRVKRGDDAVLQIGAKKAGGGRTSALYPAGSDRATKRAYRKAKKEGLSGDALVTRANEILANKGNSATQPNA